MPTEQELCREFGVSRSPLREALKVLEAEGLITIRHGEGMFVSELPEAFARRSDFLTLKEGVTALHVLDVRRILELESVRQAAKAVPPVDVSRLRELLSVMEENKEDVALFREADVDFHLTLGELSGNPVLAQILRELRSVFLDQMARDPLVNEASRDHAAILQAVERGDVDGAQRAMERHLDRMYDFYLADGEDNHEWRDAP
ncbi:MAG: FadR family transcriptional regulator [Firmicutes bacterium]|nr:FadR family transcriptional regulator [Bacillota bacterium]